MTKSALDAISHFLQQENRVLRRVRIDRFLFDDADYTAISRKELQEISEIFGAFGLHIRPLESPAQMMETDRKSVV